MAVYRMVMDYADEFTTWHTGVEVYNSSSVDSGANILEPTLKLELNKAGSLEFTVEENHPLYRYFSPMISFLTITLDEEVLFHGRVLYSTTDFYRQKKVYAEGDLAYLVDTVIEPSSFTGTKQQLLAEFIRVHNANIEIAANALPDKALKKLYLGQVTAEEKNEEITFGSDGYQDTWSAINDTLLKNNNSFIRTRFVQENGTWKIYLDWIKDYNRTNTQRIEFARNLLELEDDVDGNEIFTVLIPLGKNKLTIETVTEQHVKYILADQNSRNKYGLITRAKEFSEIDDAEKLYQAGAKYMTQCLKGINHKYSVTAVDLHFLDATKDILLLGDKVTLVSPLQNINNLEQTLMDVQYDLRNPENTQYTFGIPEQADPGDSSASNHVTKSSSGNGGGSGGVSEHLHKYIEETNDTLKLHAKNISVTADEVLSVSARTLNVETGVANLRTDVINLDSYTKDTLEVNLKRDIQINAQNIQTNANNITTTANQIAAKADTVSVNSRLTTLESKITQINSIVTNLDSTYVKVNGTMSVSNLSATTLTATTAEFNSTKGGRITGSSMILENGINIGGSAQLRGGVYISGTFSVGGTSYAQLTHKVITAVSYGDKMVVTDVNFDNLHATRSPLHYVNSVTVRDIIYLAPA